MKKARVEALDREMKLEEDKLIAQGWGWIDHLIKDQLRNNDLFSVEKDPKIIIKIQGHFAKIIKKVEDHFKDPQSFQGSKIISKIGAVYLCLQSS